MNKRVYIFDIDDTLITHTRDNNDYYKMENDSTLKNLIETLNKDGLYIYTNGTYGHGVSVIKNLQLTDSVTDLFARDTIPFMKPLMGSFTFVNNEIQQDNYQLINEIYFFDDMIDNLRTAKKMTWKTIWISPQYKNHTNHPDIIDYAFPNIYEALLYFNQKKYY